jgi:Protein of unknown function (DUF616)
MEDIDKTFVKKCKFVVASGIFDGYDVPQQPSNISTRSKKLFCFLMVVDEVSLDFIKQNTSMRVDKEGGKWVGIWRLVTLHNLPFDEPRRNGKVPKILTHRLFPQARYSIWIDGKMELIVDPLLILERCVIYNSRNAFMCTLKMVTSFGCFLIQLKRLQKTDPSFLFVCFCLNEAKISIVHSKRMRDGMVYLLCMYTPPTERRNKKRLRVCFQFEGKVKEGEGNKLGELIYFSN